MFEPTNAEDSNTSDNITCKKDKLKAESDLYAACEGRTAHKGARHGLQLSGKLLRIAQQERKLLASSKLVAEAEPTETELRPTKKKKRKHKVSDQSDDETHENPHAVCKESIEIVCKKKRKSKLLEDSEN